MHIAFIIIPEIHTDGLVYRQTHQQKTNIQTQRMLGKIDLVSAWSSRCAVSMFHAFKIKWRMTNLKWWMDKMKSWMVSATVIKHEMFIMQCHILMSVCMLNNSCFILSHVFFAQSCSNLSAMFNSVRVKLMSTHWCIENYYVLTLKKMWEYFIDFCL